MTLLIYLAVLAAGGMFDFIHIAFGVAVWLGHVFWNAIK